MRYSRPLTASMVLLALAACRDQTAPTDPTPRGPSFAAGSEAQDSRIIVVFRSDVADPPGLARLLTSQLGGTLRFTYTSAIKGFAGSFPAAALDGLRNHPSVAYIEPDAEVQLHDTQTPTPAWGIDRIDQRDLPLNNSYTYANNGADVNIYILDTGIRLTHTQFGNRAHYVPGGTNGDFVGDGRGNASDCHGHGTHVAGTAAGSTYGVAKGATIWAARVVNCQGSGDVSMAIAAVDWVTGNAIRPASVNMSLGYGNVQSLRDAVTNSIAADVNYAVSAGNGSWPLGTPQDACSGSPAGAPNANTVGATASNDTEASFSNYGSCVDILAPGVSILSAWYNGDNATNTISGTSMSSPHVAGAIALYLAANPGATPAQVSQALKDNASLNKIDLHSRSETNGTANRLLYVGFIGGGGPPANAPPVASFTFGCTGLTCNFTDGSTDSDGTIASRSWNFGDGNNSTATNPSHTYSAGGTYPVTLLVTDDDGATNQTTRSVTVTASGITLSATGYKVKGVKHADLTWSGATGAVIVKRNGVPIATTTNTSYTDTNGGKGGGSLTYQVCLQGTPTTCSNIVTVTY